MKDKVFNMDHAISDYAFDVIDALLETLGTLENNLKIVNQGNGMFDDDYFNVRACIINAIGSIAITDYLEITNKDETK